MRNGGANSDLHIRWNEITQVVILNSDPGRVGPANGYLAMYHNGRLAFERTDMVYRTNSSVGISQLFFRCGTVHLLAAPRGPDRRY